ncbi:hypothetical protein L596_012396 [Steinernema carpocapsae]|uniref:WAP domain-containing protein n=1 Tax=Steinernema carpocapsae TaxID=34508 RepID=A0A4U5NXT5_STECR|nr:hypothetical protein L596_012396 [Steinernema carpocapsae]
MAARLLLSITLLSFALCVSSAPHSKGEYVQSFFFDHIWKTCLATKLLKSEIPADAPFSPTREGCLMPMDDLGCPGPTPKNFADYKEKKKSTNSYAKLYCEDVICPKGYECQMGMMAPFCCNFEYQKMINEANSDKCPNGAMAAGVKGQYSFQATFGMNCSRLMCEKGYKCVQVNKEFAKCCKA